MPRRLRKSRARLADATGEVYYVGTSEREAMKLNSLGDPVDYATRPTVESRTFGTRELE